jgi:dTDP-6-deoxy-L-talose 4-dehydrogenase (NAD+)
MKNKIRKIFITGANGFIGKNLLNYLSKKKFNVFYLSRCQLFKKKNLVWVKGTLTSNLVKYIKNCDLLIHCAASGVLKHRKQKKNKIFNTNFYYSYNFLNKCYEKNLRKWIIFGSCSEYGLGNNKALSANKTKLAPIDFYGKSKVKLFKKIKKNKKFKKCQILYLRPFHIYGENESEKRLYGSFIKAIKKNKPFKIYNKNEIRNFTNINILNTKIYKSFNFFYKKKNFFIIKHISSGIKKNIKDFIIEKSKLLKNKNKIIFINKNIKTNSMFSDKKSLL